MNIYRRRGRDCALCMAKNRGGVERDLESLSEGMNVLDATPGPVVTCNIFGLSKFLVFPERSRICILEGKKRIFLH